MARRRRAGNLDEQFRGLLTAWIANNQNYNRILKLGNLGRSGGLTQLTFASQALSDSSNALLTFVSQNPQYLPQYRTAIANVNMGPL